MNYKEKIKEITTLMTELIQKIGEINKVADNYIDTAIKRASSLMLLLSSIEAIEKDKKIKNG